MLNSELFVALTAAAMSTSRIRLGPGVMIPGNRIAPVAASGLASLNALAPGRIDWGLSTGSTARSTMGLTRVKQADMEEYIRIVRALLNGETPEWTFEDKRRKIRFMDPVNVPADRQLKTLVYVGDGKPFLVILRGCDELEEAKLGSLGFTVFRPATPEEIVIETLAAEVSERGATRMDDQTSEASMELRKKEGYF